MGTKYYSKALGRLLTDEEADTLTRVKVNGRVWRGLGDAVASIANPIAAASDSLLGTHIKGCGGCAKRQAYLNNLVPFSQK